MIRNNNILQLTIHTLLIDEEVGLDLEDLL